jgi:hypothetical protein
LLARAAGGDSAAQPFVRSDLAGLGGVSGLAFGADAAGGVPDLFGLARTARPGLGLSRLDLDAGALSLAVDDALRLDALAQASESRGIVLSAATSTAGAERRAYVSLRFPESSTAFNAGIGVVRVTAAGLELLRVLEVGEELGRPALLERGGRRLLYVPDLRLDAVHVIDVTTDVPVALARIGGRAPRTTADGTFDARLLDGPAGVAFAEVEGRALGFVTSFASSTLAVLDVAAADPRDHRVIARFGRTIDALGQPEGP